MNVTADTKNITLHAVDMKIDRSFTNIKEYIVNNSKSKIIAITEQRNDTDRQFHVIKTSSMLKKGKQYVVNLRFIGHLNDYLEGFYRSSYMVGNQIR